MLFAKILVTSEWLLTLGFVSFLGITISHVLGQMHHVAMQSSLWILFEYPSLESLLKLLG